MIRESDIEKELCRQVKKIGGLCLKFVSPGYAGVPDRLVIYNGKMWLVELKSPTGKLRKSQKICHNEMTMRGVAPRTLYSIKEIIKFINNIEVL